MTNDGFDRLATLFINDIDSIKYELDGVTQTIDSINLSMTVLDARIIIEGEIPTEQSGEITNFRLVSTTSIVYDYRANLEFTKGPNKSVVFTIPYRLENKAV